MSGSALGRRVAKLAELAENLAKRQILAIPLSLKVCPEWATPVADGVCVYLIGGDARLRTATLEALRSNAETMPEGVVLHDYRGKPGASQLIAEMNGGEGTENADEVAGWGARGDRKTSATLDGWLILADRHRTAGYALPYRVMVPTGSHTEHKLKLVRTLAAPHWFTIWTLRDDDHEAIATVDGSALLALDLFGTSDADASNKLRAETCGLWAEEAAPAANEGSSGVTQDSWSIGLTSMRMKTRRKVAVLTSNYPDEDFWGWVRFETDPADSTVSIRIPPGESASAEDRERWRVALAARPDLLDRLVNGEPATIPQGPQVAVGYRSDVHVARSPIPLFEYLEIWCGWDSSPNAHTHALVIAQRNGRRRNIFAALVGEQMPFVRFLESIVLPWFERRAPWIVRSGGAEWVFHRGDPTMEQVEPGDMRQTPQGRIRAALGGSWAPGASDWPGRIDPLMTLFGDTDGAGGPALQIDPGPDTLLLRKTFGGRWYYTTTRNGTVIRDLPAKPNHPYEDVGDAACYLAGVLAPDVMRYRRKPPGWKPAPAKGRYTSVFDRPSSPRDW